MRTRERPLEGAAKQHAIAQIHKLKAQGLTLGEIAARIGLNKTSTNRLARRIGYDRAADAERRLADIHALHRKGLGAAEIAARVGLSDHQVRHWLRRSNLRAARPQRATPAPVEEDDSEFIATERERLVRACALHRQDLRNAHPTRQPGEAAR